VSAFSVTGMNEMNNWAYSYKVKKITGSIQNIFLVGF
jgi:hypothetical protein